MENRWIQPFYQPIIRSINGQVCDEEALARWIDPGKGMIPPDKFISVLEDAKLIHKLDLYIVDRVLEDMKKASDLGMQIVPVSINLSKYDFKLCDIVAEIEKRVKAAGFPTKLITLEVTESIATFENEFVTTQIKKVHDAGFEIWMDDFGSGYSSLNMLQDYDFDAIKFDLRFMREFANNKKSHIIMKELMQMADKLDIDTVVEGVETLEQSKFLREIGANKMQGYYLGKPNSYDDTVTIITNDIGNHAEPPEESEYYDLISKANLIEPDIDDDYIINSEEYFGPMPMGVIEYDGKHFRILRYNKTYALFLIKTNFATQEDLGKGIINVQREPEPNFIKAVNKCIESKRWENITQSEENGYLCDVFLKLISKNPNTGAVAVEIVVSSVN
jgi:EAL domain-containing protein (putative c-di-GMP-specific phosphodiesterase class I)